MDASLQSRAQQLADEFASQASTAEDLNGFMRLMMKSIRRAIYTSNAIESVNSVIRKFTRNRKIYPNEEFALKIVYMAIREASRKWTMPIHNWKQALNHVDRKSVV